MPLGTRTKILYIVHLFLEIVFIYKFFWYHGYMYHYLFCSIHLIFQVKVSTSMHMYIELMSGMALLTCSFIVVKYDVGGLTSLG